MIHQSSNTLTTTADAARRLGLTPARVRQLATSGSLPHTRTSTGTRLFRLDDIERFARDRAERKR